MPSGPGPSFSMHSANLSRHSQDNYRPIEKDWDDMRAYRPYDGLRERN